MDQDSLLRASAILDLLAIGWRPGDAELDCARYIERWAVLPGASDKPYQIIGVAWSLPIRRHFINTSVLAIDPIAHWARIWDEWAVIDDGLWGLPPINPIEIQRVGAAWLVAELRQLYLY